VSRFHPNATYDKTGVSRLTTGADEPPDAAALGERPHRRRPRGRCSGGACRKAPLT
jgi:hypothetical protein